MNTLYAIVFAGGLLGLAACSSQIPEPTFDETGLVSVQAGQFMAPSAGTPAERLKGDREASMEASGVAVQLIQRSLLVMQGSLPTSEKIDRVTSILDDSKVDPAARWIADQTVSGQSLRLLLNDSGSDPEAIGFFVDRLVAAGSPQADLVLRGLNRLDEVWSDTKREQVAEAAARNVDRWTEESCTDCIARGAGPEASQALSAKEAILVSASRLQANVQ